ncbi:MAG: zinc transporter [Gammaproteobacteria bacterium]|jgi:zinc transporter
MNRPAGQDQGLLICSYKLLGDGSGTMQELGQDALRTGEFHWHHLRWDEIGIEEWLRDKQIDKNVIEALVATETRPRTIKFGNGLLVILRGVNSNPGADPEDMISIRVWISDGVVISTRKKNRRLLSIDDIRSDIDTGMGPTTPAAFLVSLVKRLADRIGYVVDEIDDQLTQLETMTDDVEPRELRPKLAEARRQSASLRRYLAPQRDALDTLYRIKDYLTDDDTHALREQTDRTTRYVEDLDLARERAMVLQEELRNRTAEQQNLRVYILSLVTAVFLPLSFLTGVFGMNVAGLPGTENPTAFIYLAMGMSVLAVSLILVFRWRRWL